MKRLALAAALAASLGSATPARAVLGIPDVTPAATLLLPYFEVHLDDPWGVSTLLSINNASASATLAHVVLWTDWSVHSLDFSIYLTGYDVATINLRDIFLSGNLPITASDAQDPTDTTSPQGPLSQDITFPGCAQLPYSTPALPPFNQELIRQGHSGRPVPSLANTCVGASHGDDVARGYITIDVVNACSLLFAGDPGYFVDGGLGIAANRNMLWGDFFLVDPGNNFAFGDNLVHIEADAALGGPPAPSETGYTFYGRYAPLGIDNREPLGSVWVGRFLNGAGFDGGTDLIVWRDSTSSFAPNPGYSCAAGPSWEPLFETRVFAFDEAEDVYEVCYVEDGQVSPPFIYDPACFPLETGRYQVGVGDLLVPFEYGWLYLDLNHLPDAPAGDVDFGPNSGGRIAQSFVLATHKAKERYQVGFEWLMLQSALVDAFGPLTGESPPIFIP